MKAYQKSTLAVAAAFMLTLSACSGGAGTNSGSKTDAKGKDTNTTVKANWNPQPRENVKDGGEIKLSLDEIPADANAFHGTSFGATNEIWYKFNPSITYAPKADGEIEFDKNYVLGVKDELKDGKTVVTYTLEPKGKFNDGTPIDVKAFETLWTACNGVNKAYECATNEGYKLVESVKAGKDNFEVVVTYKQGFPWWKSFFSTPLHPKLADPEFFTKGYLDGKFNPELGAGPFKIDNIDSKLQVATFVRNEKWWGDAPKLEKITLKVLEDQARIQSFKNGEIDATRLIDADKLKQVDGMANIEVRRGTRPATHNLQTNPASDALKDIKVREAIMRGIDRVALAKLAFQGLDWNETAPGSLVLFPFQKGYQDNYSKVMAFDVEKAKALLDEAGWKMGKEYREKDGKVLELRNPVFGESPILKNRAIAVESMLKTIGVKLKIEQKAGADFTKVVNGRDYDLLMMVISAGDKNGVAGMCDTYCSTSTSNHAKTTDEAFDKKVDQMQKLPTEEEQTKVANDLEVEALKTYGIMPLYNGTYIMAVKKGMVGYGSPVFGGLPIQDVGWQK